MMNVLDLRKKNIAALKDGTALRNSTAVDLVVNEILTEVRSGGDAAVRTYVKKFDGANLAALKVPEKEIAAVAKKADPEFRSILKEAAENIRAFHRAQVRKPFVLKGKKGSELRQIFRPMDRVGVYVPGGKAAYPSTVLMNVIPAQVAGVSEIHLVTPPDRNGNVHPDVLLAASLLGVKNVYRVGGAQAVAALAFGTESIPAVDKIVGPGNIYVATAKRMVYGIVGIDSIAGPSEVVIIADATADPAFVAADLLAQAEHDERAVPILVTPSVDLAKAVQSAVAEMSHMLERRTIIEQSLRNEGRIYLVSSLDQAVAVSNHLAPEHLQIITKSDEAELKKIRHAGSIFLGPYSPVAVGDYFAGPNHVLPTERTARFSSPLSVDDFVKRSSVIRYTKSLMESSGERIARFADHEGLSAHAFSLRLRTKAKGKSKR